MNPNDAYANYMLVWLSTLELPRVTELNEVHEQLTASWQSGVHSSLAAIRARLWAWLDAHEGPRLSSEKTTLYARMLLCLCEADNRELEDMGFFDDLLNHFGISRTEINRFDRQLPPHPDPT